MDSRNRGSMCSAAASLQRPHLAEWQAFSAREILFHLDQSVHAKNLAQAQAKKHASHLVQDDAEEDGPAGDEHRFVDEDIGGSSADFDDEEESAPSKRLPKWGRHHTNGQCPACGAAALQQAAR